MFNNENEYMDIMSVEFETPQVGQISNNGAPTIWEMEQEDFAVILPRSKIPFIDKRVAYNKFNKKTKTAIFYRTNSNEYGVFVTPQR